VAALRRGHARRIVVIHPMVRLFQFCRRLSIARRTLCTENWSIGGNKKWIVTGTADNSFVQDKSFHGQDYLSLDESLEASLNMRAGNHRSSMLRCEQKSGAGV